MNHIRSCDFWIINCNTALKSCILKCAICRHLRENFQQQKMASLQRDRLCEESPFTYCGVNLFGQFVTKEGRKEIKCYGCLFTCLSSRAIHNETVASLNTDLFILHLCQFTSRRGNKSYYKISH